MLDHHAYFYEGDASRAEAVAESARSAIGFKAGDLNVVVHRYEKFGIDESRALRELAQLKSTGNRALFVIATSSITGDAQQALLKLFEEPQRGTVFVLVVPHGVLLPTLRSRCLAFPLMAGVEPAAEKKANIEAQEFLKCSYKERTERIAKLIKDNDDDVRGRAREFLSALEREVYAEFNKTAGDKKLARAHELSEIALLRGYLADRSASLKMIFEHLAAALPKAQ